MSRLGWLIFVLIVILVLGCFGATGVIDFAFTLVVGWIPYLIRVVPRVNVSPAGVATAAVCFFGAMGIGHALMGWFWRESHRDTTTAARAPAVAWRVRWTLSFLAVVVLMFVAGIGATGVTHQSAWLARSSKPMFEYRSRERVNRVKCMSNLRQIGYAIKMYAAQHENRLPDSLAVMLPTVDITPEVFICPASDDEKAAGAGEQEQVAQTAEGAGHNSYVYYGRGLVLPLPDDLPIACEPLGNHAGEGMNILFGDGRVDWFDPAGAEKVLRSAARPATFPATRPAR